MALLKILPCLNKVCIKYTETHYKQKGSPGVLRNKETRNDTGGNKGT